MQRFEVLVVTRVSIRRELPSGLALALQLEPSHPVLGGTFVARTGHYGGTLPPTPC